MRALSTAMVMGLVSVCVGCASSPDQGYSFTDAYRKDIRTVSVPIFENSTFSHGLEFTLTDAVIKEIHRSTPWRVASGDQADTTLSGTITNAALRRLSRQSETGMVQELAMDLVVNFQWKQNRTGEVLLARQNFHAADPFVPVQGAQERLNLGERAAIDQMAKDLVAELRSSW